MRVRYSAKSRRDLARIEAAIEPRGPETAARIVAAIETVVKRAGTRPFTGRAQDAEGVFKLVDLRYGYVVFYTVAEAAQAVQIVSIYHGKEDWPYDNSQYISMSK